MTVVVFVAITCIVFVSLVVCAAQNASDDGLVVDVLRFVVDVLRLLGFRRFLGVVGIASIVGIIGFIGFRRVLAVLGEVLVGGLVGRGDVLPLRGAGQGRTTPIYPQLPPQCAPADLD